MKHLLGDYKKFITRTLIGGLLLFMAMKFTGQGQLELIGAAIGLLVGASTDQGIRLYKGKKNGNN